MYVEFSIPDLPDVRVPVSEFWTRYVFVGSPSNEYQVNALASSFMRLTDAAIREYHLGAQALRGYWTPNQANLDFHSLNRAIFHFESSLTATHRAIDTFRKLRNRNSNDQFVLHIRLLKKPQFISDRVANTFREVRNTIQHFSDLVVSDQITEGQPLALKPEGEEISHPNEAGQTIKTFDRVIVGPHELRFQDIAITLIEISEVATHFSKFVRLPSPSTIGAGRILGSLD